MDRPPFMAPLMIQNAAARALQKLGHIFQRSNSSQLCQFSQSDSLSPSPCQDSPCTWAAMLLQALVPSVHARAEKTSLDTFMEDLRREPLPSKKGHPFSSAYPAADRVVALGDVHGDASAMRTALRKAALIDDKDAWTGGKAVLVQVGDQLDRGDTEREIYNLLFRLQDTAPAAGGAVHILLGNHELMNMQLDFRYVTAGGFSDFARDGGVSRVFGKRFKARVPAALVKEIRMLPKSMQMRARALVTGGPLAVELAQRARVSVIVGDSVFVHAGLSTKHFKYDGREGRDARATLHELNEDTSQYLQGHGGYPKVLHEGDSPLWMRDYSRPGVHRGSPECRMLNDTLRMIGVKRMVVGHTPQAEGINSACGGKVWRIDTGMSRAYGGVPEAIEISKRGNVKIHTADGVVQGSARCR